MRRVIRPFVFWLLALALPLQGLAAATMLHCVPAADAARHAAHEHHASMAHDGDAQIQVHKCSACAACSVGLALPSASHTLPEPAVAPQAAPAPDGGHAAFFTSGPERPPRARA
ncbi:MAG: hypothetical protein HS128_09380 [Ideonella sp.]|nr:hypothetical protein [Ideonella sp.]MCC7456501.1 hypothetical protein [Nitrospira sp.]